MSKKLVLTFFVCVLGLASVCRATISVPSVFTDHAVFQQGMPVPVWGTASSGEQVTVDFDGQSKLTTADGNGDWMVTLDPMTVSSVGSDMVITGTNTITITDVWVGEVWFFSGQSNMKRELSRSANAAEAIADAPNHNIRWYNATQQWEDLATASRPLKNVSAVAYYFMHDLVHEYTGNIAMGIYQATSPGTDLTRFTTVQGDGSYYLDRIVPMQPYAIKGALWYQGENDGADINEAVEYDWVFTGLIDEWRTDWGQGDFPFGIVQLHDHSSGTNPIGWPVVQDAQLRVSLAVSNTGLGVNWDTTLDGAPGHPDAKRPIAERMSLWARSQVYGQTGFGYSSPIPNPILSSINGNEIVIGFDYIAAGLITNDGAAPSYFEVAGSDDVYYVADGQIVGNTVVVSSSSVPSPESVRHVWIDQYWPLSGALYNSDMLPAPVFEMSLTGGSFCDDGTCDPGEDECNCPADCGTPPATETNCTDGIDEDCDGGADCNDPTGDCDSDPACLSSCNNNGTCETGEDCNNCSNDCISKTSGNPNSQYCCGDGTCEGAEDSTNCAVDCGAPVCGDGTCDPGEDNSNCPADCPPSSCNNNSICEPGEDCNNCSNDCDSVTGGNPANRYCCGDGEQTGPEGDGRCDGNY